MTLMIAICLLNVNVLASQPQLYETRKLCHGSCIAIHHNIIRTSDMNPACCFVTDARWISKP